MDIIYEDPDLYKELLVYLAEVYKSTKKNLKFPTQVSYLQHLYEKEISVEIKRKLLERFSQLKSWNPIDVDSLLEHNILTPLESKNYNKLRKFIDKTLGECLDKISLPADFNIDEIQKLLEDNIPNNDAILLDIADGLNAEHQSFNKADFDTLNKRIQLLCTTLILYQQLLYFKYEMSDLFYVENSDIRQATITKIWNHLKEMNPGTMKDMDKVFKACQTECTKEFKEVFENNLNELFTKSPKVGTYVDAYKSSRNYLLSLFKENTSNKLGAIPNEVFASHYLKQIDDQIKNSIILEKLHTSLMQDYGIFKNTIYYDLKNMFKDFCFLNGAVINLFDEKMLNGKENLARLFSIVILTDYIELDDTNYEKYLDTLQIFYLTHASNLNEECPLQNYIQLVSSKQKRVNNRSVISEFLELERSKWSQNTGPNENLYAMACLFMAFNQIRDSSNNKSYTSHDRFMLKCIFRNLKNGENRFTNFQILCGLEALIMEFQTHTDVTTVSMKDDKATLSREVLKQIRSTNVSSFSEHLTHKDQIFRLHDKLDSSVKKPSKFFLEKISDPKIHSKVITICASGFTSEDITKAVQWQDIVQANPYTEVFALNWNSSTMTNMYDYFLKEAGQYYGAYSGLILMAIPQLKPVMLGMTAFQTFRGVKDQLWGKTYQEAITTGTYLAHIIGDTDLFKDHVINLVGFSLGTLVMMSCIWELEKMNRQDIIYDVLLAGGVVNGSDFNKETLSVVGHKVTNCYCLTDFVLKVLLKAVNFNSNPIGLGPILYADKKVKNINVSKLVDGHTKYREKLKEILVRVDFNEDLHYLL